MKLNHQDIERVIIKNIALLSSVNIEEGNKEMLENDIFHSGYIDSFGIVSLIAILEEHFEISIGNAYLNSDTIRTIKGMASIIYKIKSRNNNG